MLNPKKRLSNPPVIAEIKCMRIKVYKIEYICSLSLNEFNLQSKSTVE